MLFGITSFVLIIFLSLKLTLSRYLDRLPGEEKKLTSENWKGYVKWIFGWKKSFLKLERWDRCLNYLISWGKKNYQGWTVWFFYILVLSYGYQALSGLAFAWFVPRGLFGFPLLLHVAAGAVFALCLVVILFLKARVYLPEKLSSSATSQTHPSFYCSLLKMKFPRLYLQAVAFWVYALAGFLLVASILGSMLPYFNYPAQILFFHLHRWSALASILSAILSLDSIIE
ncbi:MAG: hypothetical protein ACPLRA_04575 [Candidatus Saccharicenans sp.]